MCGDGWCDETALRLVSVALEAVSAGQAARPALCSALSGALGGGTVIYLLLRADGRAITDAYPIRGRARLGALELLAAFPEARRRVLDELVPFRASADLEPAAWHAWTKARPPGDPFAVAEVAALPLHATAARPALLLLSRGHELSDREAHLLDRARRPLGALDRALPRPASDATDAAGLTPREAEVLKMLSQGMLARTIASRMNVSPRTVHKHLGSVYRKLGAHDRLIAVDRARTLGLLTP